MMTIKTLASLMTCATVTFTESENSNMDNSNVRAITWRASDRQSGTGFCGGYEEQSARERGLILSPPTIAMASRYRGLHRGPWGNPRSALLPIRTTNECISRLTPSLQR